MVTPKQVLLGALVAVAAAFTVFWIVVARRHRTERGGPTPLGIAIGFVTNFFDTLGIGSFATTTTIYRLRNLVADQQIPGTLNVGHAWPTFVQALIYTQIVDVQFNTLALLILAARVLCLGLPLAAVMRHKPEQYGYLPDGEPLAPPSGATTVTEAIPTTEDGLTTREALRTPAFWLMSFAFSIRVGVTGSVALHFIPFLTDIGAGLGTAGLMLTAVGVIGITGRIAFGWLGDLFPKRYVVTGGLCSLSLGLLVLAFSTELWHVGLALILYAPAYGGLATMMFAMRSEYFGRRSFATIQGFMGSVLVIGTVSGPIYAGWIFDVTNSYRIAFLTFAAAAGIAILLILAAKPIRQPDALVGS